MSGGEAGLLVCTRRSAPYLLRTRPPFRSVQLTTPNLHKTSDARRSRNFSARSELTWHERRGGRAVGVHTPVSPLSPPYPSTLPFRPTDHTEPPQDLRRETQQKFFRSL